MPIIKACCCWDSLRKGSKGSAALTVVVGLINSIIDIAIIVFLHHLDSILEEHEKYTWLMPGIIVFMYIELMLSLGMMVLALVLNIGINQGIDGRILIRVWTVGVLLARLYEFMLGVYVISWLGAFRVPEIVYMAPEVNLMIAYWVLANILFVAAIICVQSYWQELLDELYGKERRTKYYSKLLNIRAAHRDHTGTTTPMSYWSRSRGPSHAPSHLSLAQPPHSASYSNPSFSQSSYPQRPSQSSSSHVSVHQPQPQHHMSQSSYNSAAQYAPQKY